MIGKKINKKIIPEEEDDNDLIINNDDDFYVDNDLKNSQNKNQEINKDYNPPKDSEIPSSQKGENINESKSNDRTTNRNIFTPVPNNPSVNVNSKETAGEEKTIFSKITEDLYLDNKLFLQPKKVYFDMSKIKEDNYNKLTTENYLFTCADKENSKNNKIINSFLERKTKELNNKKIGNDPEKDEKENLLEIKAPYSDRKKEKKGKNLCRSPEQFLKEQKILEEKHKNYIDKLTKKYIEEEKNAIKNKPTICKKSEKIMNMKKTGNKDIHLKLYEDYNIKKQKLEEANKNYFIFNENIKTTKYKKVNKDEIMQYAKKLHKDFEKRKNYISENKIKQLNDIKNMSAVSLIEKKSNFIVYKKLIKKYKNEMKTLFNKNISDKFDINYSDYLSFIYKLDLVEKDYSDVNNIKQKNTNMSKGNNLDKIFNIKYNNIDQENYNTNIKNKIIFSKNILKRNTYFKSKSIEKIKIDEEFEIKTVNNAWKMITKAKEFSKDEKGNSRRILYFILSVYGIYKGDLNDNFVKKEFPFLSKEEDKSYFIDISLSRQIYKYFSIFRNMAINKISAKNKEKEQDQEQEQEDVQNKSTNLIKYKKTRFKSGHKFYVNTIEYSSNNINKKDISQYNKNFSTSRSTKKISYFHKLKNDVHKSQSINNISVEKKEKIIFKLKAKNNITNNNKKYEKNLNNNNSQQDLNKLKKNLKQKKETIIKKKINLNKGMNSNSTKNISYKINESANLTKNYNSIKNIKIKNTKNPINNVNQKINQNKNIVTPTIKNQILNQKDKNNLKLDKGKNLVNNKISKEEQEKKIIEEKKEIIKNEIKEEDKPKIEAPKHQKEKNSSISNYIFKEDYRIKEDIESNSNLNNFEETENNENKKVSKQNFSQSEFSIQKNDDVKSASNILDSKNMSEQNKSEEKNRNISDKKKKSKFIFKIKVKDKLIKLIVNRGDDIESKINAFCKENDLDEDDKAVIFETINTNLNAL